MLPTSLSTPTPPLPPQTPSPSIGDAVRGAVNDAVAGALAGTRAELQQQLSNLEAQREGLQAALKSTSSRPARASIQGELDRVERDISKMQSGLDKLDRQLTTRDGPPRTFASTAPAPQFPNFPVTRFDPTPLVFGVLGILFVAFPLTLAMVRFLWKRASNAPAPPLSQEQVHRFDRIEQSVDAIAIEVERISENQRYLTRLLAEPKQAASVGSGGQPTH